MNNVTVTDACPEGYNETDTPNYTAVSFEEGEGSLKL
jgi:hypothetical protein